jgi:glutamate 5-kinase
MTTKIEAGKIATQAGTAMIIAKGTALHPLRALAEGARHTLFKPVETPIAARKRWIMGTLDVCGALHIDAGAWRALAERNASLLPAGISSVTGSFVAGDPVDVVDAGGAVVARGLVNYDADELPQLLGRSTKELAAELGADYEREVIHRDDLVLLRTAAVEG